MQLNLTEGYAPIINNVDEIPFTLSTFPGGEPNIKIDVEPYKWVDITIRLSSFNDLGVLLMAHDAVKRAKSYVPRIVIPYMPGARQDRVMQPGEALSVKVYAELLNTLKSTIVIIDPHSDVTPALLDAPQIVTNHQFVKDIIFTPEFISLDAGSWEIPYAIVSPDAGANKKSQSLMESLDDEMATLVKCDKTRNVKTGEITNFDVYANDLKGMPCFVVDDICSNGGTFLGLADELKKKNAGNLYLIVTHGEFGHDRNRTIRRLQQKYKQVYFSDSFPGLPEHLGFGKQIKITINNSDI